MKQSYAWEYEEPLQDGSIPVRFLDWPSDFKKNISVGESITVKQNRFRNCEGDNSETIANIGDGKLRLTIQLGKGCGSQTHILEA